MPFLFLLIVFPLLTAIIDFFGFLIKGRRIVNLVFLRMAEIGAFLILPYMYVSLDTKNDCCGDSAAFSPEHQLTIWVLVALCLIAYFYSSYRKLISTPVLEVIINSFLVFGIVLNIFIAIQTKDIFYAAGGNLPIILFAILALAKNQKAFIGQSRELEISPKGRFETFAWQILKLKPIVKFPVIFVLCLPVLVIITSILLLFGQKPDSVIRAFTDTYKHGFSQWDYKCDNVLCGGHYLCSVGANGHAIIVQPQRRGIRNGNNIVCNRQLLISNAFEDLLQERVPFLHKQIRRQYNRVGNAIHKYYYVFDNKFVADLVYLLMKPLEWLFLFTLYTLDRKPENRIAKQYISNTDRQQIDIQGTAL